MDIRRRLMMQMASGDLIKVEAGSFTPEADIEYGNVNARIPHSLGVAPDFIMAYADGIEALASYTDNEKYICWFAYGKINTIGDQTTRPYIAMYVRTRPGYNGTINQYENINQKFVADAYFHIGGYQSTDKLKGGVTYRYVIGKYRD